MSYDDKHLGGVSFSTDHLCHGSGLKGQTIAALCLPSAWICASLLIISIKPSTNKIRSADFLLHLTLRSRTCLYLQTASAPLKAGTLGRFQKVYIIRSDVRFCFFFFFFGSDCQRRHASCSTCEQLASLASARCLPSSFSAERHGAESGLLGSRRKNRPRCFG